MIKKLTLLSLLFCIAVFGAYASNDSLAIANLAKEIEALKAQNTKNTKLLAAMPKISGIVQARYDYTEDESSTFSLKRVRLSAAGKITNRVDYKIQVEFASSVKLLDGYVNYNHSDGLRLKFGQYKIPFTIENTDYGPSKLEVIEHAMVLQRLVGMSEINGIKGTGREMGATLYGNLIGNLLSYDLGVYNGEGINTKDANKSKDVVVRLLSRPVNGLLLASYYMHGEHGVDHEKRNRFGFGACYNVDQFIVRSEYVAGTTGLYSEDVDSYGWYLLGGWKFSSKFMGVARYDTFTLDRDDNDNTRETDYTAGVLWTPVKNLRLQANYVYKDFSEKGLDGKNMIQLQVSAIF